MLLTRFRIRNIVVLLILKICKWTNFLTIWELISILKNFCCRFHYLFFIYQKLIFFFLVEIANLFYFILYKFVCSRLVLIFLDLLLLYPLSKKYQVSKNLHRTIVFDHLLTLNGYKFIVLFSIIEYNYQWI